MIDPLGVGHGLDRHLLAGGDPLGQGHGPGVGAVGHPQPPGPGIQQGARGSAHPSSRAPTIMMILSLKCEKICRARSTAVEPTLSRPWAIPVLLWISLVTAKARWKSGSSPLPVAWTWR